MVLAGFLLVSAMHYYIILINGTPTDLSMLSSNQTQVWLKAISQVAASTLPPRIDIVSLGDGIEISFYTDRNTFSHENRYIFKENVNKRVDWYLSTNQLNPSVSSSVYDRCHGSLSSPKARANLAGLYILTDNQTSHALGIIIVSKTNVFQWFKDTELYTFDEHSVLNNGTQLLLAFETTIYYNANTDLIVYNRKIEEIVRQANVTSDNNHPLFLSMNNLSCRRHQQIVYDELRSIIFACTVEVTFQCPLPMGSSCWLEEKRISNIRLNIDSLAFISEKTITVRIDA